MAIPQRRMTLEEFLASVRKALASSPPDQQRAAIRLRELVVEVAQGAYAKGRQPEEAARLDRALGTALALGRQLDFSLARMQTLTFLFWLHDVEPARLEGIAEFREGPAW